MLLNQFLNQNITMPLGFKITLTVRANGDDHGADAVQQDQDRGALPRIGKDDCRRGASRGLGDAWHAVRRKWTDKRGAPRCHNARFRALEP